MKLRPAWLISAALSLLACASLASAAKPTPAVDYCSKVDLLARNRDLYENKVLGAWSGKLIGLIAGQPVEGWPKDETERRARLVGFYPVRYYFPSNFDSPAKGFLRGNFNSSPPNDDSDEMLAALIALRENGIGLSSKDIAEAWLKYVPGACTAEGVALENFRKGVWPPQSGSIDNPYADWIGSQMRVDIWGIVAPGMPEVAADYAELDARISHTGNGIYAARFTAALFSLAMVEKDIDRVIEGALKVIPQNCAYAQAVRDAIAWHSQCKDWQDAWKLLDAKYGVFPDGSRFREWTEEKYKTGLYRNWNDMRWVYADVNGASVTLALLYGDGDFTRSVNIAVMTGFDCDCNAGTVAGLFGAMWGERTIPTRWKAPLNDTYHTNLKIPNNTLKIPEIAHETADYGVQIMAKHGHH